MSSTKTITLDCGVVAQNWFSGGSEYLTISIIGLHNGVGQLSSLSFLSNLFNELHVKGFKVSGISRIEGYYGETDDLLLDLIKIIK